MPAQPSICHNTAEPTICLLSLLYATIQLSLLCACSAFYMPQYCQAYCMLAQPSICHNIVEPTVCLLSLLYATILPSLLYACSAFYMPQYNRAYCMPAQPSIFHNTPCVLQYKKKISLQVTIQYKYCNTIFPLHTSILQYSFPASFPYNTLLYIAIQFPSIFFSAIQPIAYKTRSQYTNCIAIQFQQPTCKPHCNTILCIAIQFSSP